jgi:superfamily II DNA or RNA helicase
MRVRMATPDATLELEETRKVLLGAAQRRFGAILPERIVDHVLEVTRDADLAIRRAALDALIRRYAFAERDELRVNKRPAGRAVLGSYGTKSLLANTRDKARPYVTTLLAVQTLRTSCSCADFVRSSLGLCKHGLVVLEHVEASGALGRPQRLGRASSGKATLHWNAEHPLRGAADRLARLRYVHAGRGQAPSGLRDGSPTPAVLRAPESRLALISDLERRIDRGLLEAEPAVLTLLHEERTRSERRVECATNVRAAMASLKGLARKLYPYQREGVQRFFDSGRLLLADDMGLGKTTQAIAACHGLFETKRVKRGVLIVPTALKAQWKREWQATTQVPIALVEGSPAERARIYQTTQHGFLIIGYEQLLRDFEHVRRLAPELVVLDEAQRIKNWATKSAAYVKALSPRYRLVLTGTPMENRFAELASIVDFVDDVALEPKWRLVPFHSVETAEANRGSGGARNLDALRERLAPIMLRRVRRDVLAQLPARTDTRVPVELTDVQRSHHDELRRPIAELANKAARRPLTQGEFLRLMQLLATQRMICNGMAQLQFESEWPRLQNTSPTPELLDSLFAPKLAALRGLIEQVALGQQRKVVVFSQWRNMLRLAHWAVHDLLAAAGQRAVFFTGAESSKLRERSVVELHDDPATTVMFLSDAGGVGLNLQRAASCCINLELPWNPAVLEQRIGRIHRLGQTLPIDVYNLVSEEGIESNIAKLLGKKSAVFSSLFDGTTDAVVFDGSNSFLENVKKIIDPVAIPENGAEDELQAQAELGIESSGEDSAGLGAPVRTDDALSVQAARAPGGEPSTQPSAASQMLLDAFQGLTVARRLDGGLRIEAPPELAAPLATLLEALAQSLRTAAVDGSTNGVTAAGNGVTTQPLVLSVE